jgi:hypothetical protein
VHPGEWEAWLTPHPIMGVTRATGPRVTTGAGSKNEPIVGLRGQWGHG